MWAEHFPQPDYVHHVCLYMVLRAIAVSGAGLMSQRDRGHIQGSEGKVSLLDSLLHENMLISRVT